MNKEQTWYACITDDQKNQNYFRVLAGDPVKGSLVLDTSIELQKTMKLQMGQFSEKKKVFQNKTIQNFDLSLSMINENTIDSTFVPENLSLYNHLSLGSHQGLLLGTSGMNNLQQSSLISIPECEINVKL